MEYHTLGEVDYKELEGKYAICGNLLSENREKDEVVQLGRLHIRRRKWWFWKKECVLELKYMTGIHKGKTISHVRKKESPRKEMVWELITIKGRKEIVIENFGFIEKDKIFDDFNIAILKV